jgi:hypothetical protein
MLPTSNHKALLYLEERGRRFLRSTGKYVSPECNKLNSHQRRTSNPSKLSNFPETISSLSGLYKPDYGVVTNYGVRFIAEAGEFSRPPLHRTPPLTEYIPGTLSIVVRRSEPETSRSPSASVRATNP